MSNINNDGLSIDSITTITNSLKNAFRNIFGDNINLDQNTPDAQIINIFAQMMISNLELLQDINSGFDPDQATGVILDQRCKYNGITRREGQYTTATVNVTFNGTATVKGLDNYDIDDCFKVSDSNGNVLVATETKNGINGETLSVQFRTLQYGSFDFAEDTITTITTPIVGISSVTNLNRTSEQEKGYDEESDKALRLRREIFSKHITNSGQNEALKLALMNLEGVKFVNILEKGTQTGTTDIPNGGIWIIIDHTGVSNKDIGEVIYKNRIVGTPMKGSSSYDITLDSRTVLQTKWTKPTQQEIYCKVEAFLFNSELSEQLVANTIAENINLNAGEMIDVSYIQNILTQNIPNIIIKSVSVSTDDETYTSYIVPEYDKIIKIPVNNIEVTIPE